MKIKWARLNDKAIIPSIATDGAGGWDFCALHDVEIPPRSQVIIGTGIAAEIPKGWVGLIRGRSGFSKRSKCLLSDDYVVERRAHRNAGVIDADYRGEIGVMLSNVSESVVQIKAGQAFAQMVVVPCITESVTVSIDELQHTARGDQGYGHTGDKR